MRLPTSEHIKSAVIDAWLMGKTRDNIASEFNVSTGSVSNIIEQWQNMIGVYNANQLRELGLALKKTGLSPVQCADGLRITNLMKQLGIDEEHLTDFLNIYNKSKEQRLLPGALARMVKVINAYPEINSLNDLPKNIDKRKQEKIKLDSDIYYRKHELNKLDHEKEKKRQEIKDLQNELETFRKEMQDEKKDFLLFRNVKEELEKNGIPILLLEPFIHVIKTFEDLHFKPLAILSEFSDINSYRDRVENRKRELKGLESSIKGLKTILDGYEMKITSNQVIMQSLHQMENLGFNASDIEDLHLVFSELSKKFGMNEKEIKIGFFRCMNSFDTLLHLEQDILKKTDHVSLLDSEISLRRKVIESQPILFSILQSLISYGLNEHYILIAFQIFKTDLCKTMPFGDETYLERLSKDLNKYPTVRDTLNGLDRNILIKKSDIDKLAVDKSNLESFLFLLVITIYVYSIVLNATKIQTQKKLKILLNINFNYYLLHSFFMYLINNIRSLLDQNSFRTEQTNNKKKRKNRKNSKKIKKRD